MSVAYQVIAPLVLVTDDAGVTHHVYQGAVVDLNKAQVDHLSALGYIAKEGSGDAVVVPGEEFTVPDSIHAPERDSSGKPLAEARPATEDVKPANVATKGAWVDFAVSKGADRGEAEALTKAELQELYG